MVSKLFSLKVPDFIKAVILAVLVPCADYLLTVIQSGSFAVDWNKLGLIAGAATYSTTNANDVIVAFDDAKACGSITSVASPFTLRFNTVAAFGTGGADFVTSTVQTSQKVIFTTCSSAQAIIVGAFKAAATGNTPAGNYRWMGIFQWIGSFIFR